MKSEKRNQARKGPAQNQTEPKEKHPAEPTQRSAGGRREGEEDRRSAAPDPYDANPEEDIDPGASSRELADEGDED